MPAACSIGSHRRSPTTSSEAAAEKQRKWRAKQPKACTRASCAMPAMPQCRGTMHNAIKQLSGVSVALSEKRDTVSADRLRRSEVCQMI